MNNLFDISPESVKNILSGAEDINEKIPERLACSAGEKETSRFLLNEIKPYCDEADEEIFFGRPSASAVIYKISCIFAIFGALFFKIGEICGSSALPCISSVLFVFAFSLFCYKYIFNGKKLDFLFTRKKSQNLVFKRYSRSETVNRIVFVSGIDSSRENGVPFLKGNAPLHIAVCSLFSAAFTFLSITLYLFVGSPVNNGFFGLLSSLCTGLGVFYVFAFFIYKKKTSVFGASSSLVPSLCCGEIMKLLCLNGIRLANTEVCVLLCGDNFLCREGASEFLSKHKLRSRDIPTYFICVDSVGNEKFALTGSKKIKYNGESIFDTVKEIADSSAIYMKKNINIFGTPSCLPFSENGFDACSIGSTGYNFKTKPYSDGIYTDENAVLTILGIMRDSVKYCDNLTNLTVNL